MSSADTIHPFSSDFIHPHYAAPGSFRERPKSVARHIILSAFRRIVLPKRGGFAKENRAATPFSFRLHAADGALDHLPGDLLQAGGVRYRYSEF